MKFAINYSPQAAALIDSQQIHVDLFKCPDWPDLIEKAEQHRPVYVHFPLNVGRANIDKVGWEHIERLLETTETLYINAHLAPDARHYDFPIDSLDPAHTEILIQDMQRDIAALVERSGAEKVILENGMWDVDFGMPLGALQPAVIRRVVHESGCGFLMDIAHAAVTCRRLGMEVREYIEELPVDRLRELHVTGTIIAPDGTWSDHEAMRLYDWDLLDWSMERIQAGVWSEPWVVAFEYGGVGPFFGPRSAANIIAEQTPRLYERCRAARPVR